MRDKTKLQKRAAKNSQWSGGSFGYNFRKDINQGISQEVNGERAVKQKWFQKHRSHQGKMIREEKRRAVRIELLTIRRTSPLSHLRRTYSSL
ncbi:hypothetical protein QL285_051852 [Trifolium repens]|nr:hypothetical protein QL285_051852 [Trifolium repens]